MTENNYECRVWESVLEYCKLKVNETPFNLWINPIVFYGIRDDKAYLGFKNDFIKKVVFDQYSILLSEAFEFVTGEHIEICEYNTFD